jgi:hypothetical protein
MAPCTITSVSSLSASTALMLRILRLWLLTLCFIQAQRFCMNLYLSLHVMWLLLKSACVPAHSVAALACMPVLVTRVLACTPVFVVRGLA